MKLILVGIFNVIVSSINSVSDFSLNKKSDTEVPKKHIEIGEASWYSVKTNRGTTTASKVPLKDAANTAAHKTLPFGTKVKITNLKNKKTEIVTVTDRGPHIKNRIIDVTVGAASKLDFKSDGITKVKIEVLKKYDERKIN